MRIDSRNANGKVIFRWVIPVPKQARVHHIWIANSSTSTSSTWPTASMFRVATLSTFCITNRLIINAYNGDMLVIDTLIHHDCRENIKINRVKAERGKTRCDLYTLRNAKNNEHLNQKQSMDCHECLEI
jgi:hypothetical protein